MKTGATEMAPVNLPKGEEPLTGRSGLNLIECKRIIVWIPADHKGFHHTEGAIMHYQMYRDVSGQWRWYLQAANGKKVADSGEGYYNEADCSHAIALVKGSSQAPVYRQ